jgi:hypothetical protein
MTTTFVFDDETFKIISEYITLEISLSDIDPALFEEWSIGNYSNGIYVVLPEEEGDIRIQIMDGEIYFEIRQEYNYLAWCEQFTEEMHNVIIGR